MLHVASVCSPCYMLLRVVGSRCTKFETDQTFELTSPNISFVPWSPKRSATTLEPAFAQIFLIPMLGPPTRITHGLLQVYNVLWVVSFPQCTAGPNIVGSCCIRLHTTANTDASTPNTAGPTMLKVRCVLCTYWALGCTHSLSLKTLTLISATKPCRQKFSETFPLVCYTAVFSAVTQRWGGALCDDSKNGCVADYFSLRSTLSL